MDPRSKQALERYGAKKILSDLVNIPVADDRRGAASEFVDRYDALRTVSGLPMDPTKDPIQDVLDWAPRLRNAWTARTEREKEQIGELINEIYQPVGTIYGIEYGIHADFMRGAWEPTPRMLLDALALELMRSRRLLHVCPGCGRYFVKAFGRERYCSPVCFEQARTKTKAQWAQEHRAELNRRQKSKRTADTATRRKHGQAKRSNRKD